MTQQPGSAPEDVALAQARAEAAEARAAAAKAADLAREEADRRAKELERIEQKMERDAARERTSSRSRSGGALDSLLTSAGTAPRREEITRTIFGTRRR